MLPDARPTGARVRNCFLYALLIALNAAHPSARAEEVVLQNQLHQCLAMEVTKTWTESNIVLTSIRFDLRKPIGECGCSSALATYATSVNRGKAHQVLQEGVIGLMNGGDKTLVVATDPALVAGKKVAVSLSCTPPL